MRDIQVFENVVLNDVTTIGDGYIVELILCTVLGIETRTDQETGIQSIFFSR